MASEGTSTYQNLDFSIVEEGIGLVTVKRPEVLNALDDTTVAEIDSCFERIAGDDAVRVVIITGDGDRAFVAGADIKELSTQSEEEAIARSRKGQQAMDRVEKSGKPVIAAINGFALGGGCELALACHLRYASSRAKIGLPEVSLGIIPGYGGTQRLQKIVGRGRAFQLILTGDMIGAGEATAIGLINGVCPPEELLEHVLGIARTIASRAPVALRTAIDAVLRGGDMELAEGLTLEAELFGSLSNTEDMREGMQAFLEKRAANFRGQ